MSNSGREQMSYSIAACADEPRQFNVIRPMVKRCHQHRAHRRPPVGSLSYLTRYFMGDQHNGGVVSKAQRGPIHNLQRNDIAVEIPQRANRVKLAGAIPIDHIEEQAGSQG
jgi:hypothetical protein